MIEKIIPQQIKERVASNGTKYITLSDGQRWMSCWLNSQGDLQNGVESEVEIEKTVKNGKEYLNIIRIGGSPVPPQAQSQPQPIQTAPQPIQPQPQPQKTAPPINPPTKLKEEVKTSNSNILIRIGNLVSEITKNTQALTEEFLTRKELELSGENFNLSKLYISGYNKTKLAEADYKKELEKKIKSIQDDKPDISQTQAKKEAELDKDMWEKKIRLITARNTLISHQTILDSVKYILLAIKDRIKFIKGIR